MSNHQHLHGQATAGNGVGLAMPPVDSVSRVLRLLRRINHATDLHSKHLIKATGLTTPQLIVLKSIQELGEVTAGTIAEHVSLSQGTVSMILDRLDTHGLIERYRSSRDRRVVHARLTEAGAQIVARSPSLLREKFIERFGRLTPDQQALAMTTLESIANMMDAEDGEDNPI